MPNDLSIAERIVAIIECRLQGIKTANGYRTDAGLRVFDSIHSVSVEELPAIVFRDGDENATNAAGSSRSFDNTLQIIVEGHVPANTAETGKALREIKADIKRAMLVGKGAIKEHGATEGLAAMTFNTVRPSPRADGDQTESAQLVFTVNFKEGYGDPYSHQL